MEKLKNIHETVQAENYVFNSAEPSEIKKSRSARHLNSIENNCLFCSKEDSKENLKLVKTFKLDVRVRHGAKLLNEFDVLTKIDDSDVVAIEKKHQNHYLSDFYRRMSNVTKNQIQMDYVNDKSVFMGLLCQK